MSGPKKISHSRFPDKISWRIRKKKSIFVHEDFDKWPIRLLEKTTLKALNVKGTVKKLKGRLIMLWKAIERKEDARDGSLS